MRILLLLPLLLGCPEEVPANDDDSAQVDPCEGVELDWSWAASEPYPENVDPSDYEGLYFYEAGFDEEGWSPVTLPHVGAIPETTDRAYRAVIELADTEADVQVTPQSDDGVWLWVNGDFVGHWGGDWQQEGCVNEAANCTDTTVVQPVAIGDLLVVGENVVAARVSNPLVDSFFDLTARCLP